jgi:hypothetical protein
MSVNRALSLLLVVILLASSAMAQDKKKKVPAKKRRPNPVFQPIEDDPKLPRVLLIGDSISIGYTLQTRSLMKGKANVHRPRTNCGPTIRGLDQIDAWLGKKKWDVIHFNWGLHDLKYMGPKGQNLADPKAGDSKQQVPPAEYEKNLRTLVERMKKTGAKLIWCATTPVPKGAAGRVVGDSKKYNDIAARVMKDYDIPTDDLYGFANARLSEIQRPRNVHFTPEGSKALAKEVAKAIQAALK